MKYVLIILTLYTSDHIEFKNKEACDVAMANVKAQANFMSKHAVVTCEWNGVSE